MIVKPVLFDNILFGELSPWHQDNASETRFRDILNNRVRASKDNPELFFKCLLESLKDYSINLKVDHLPTPERLADFAKFANLQTGFDTLIPSLHFNKASEFYRWVIMNESLRILYAISNNVKKRKLPVDKSYQVVGLLKNLEYTIEQVSIKTCSDKLCVFVLDSLKISLFRLYEEIKAMYPEHIEAESLSQEELLFKLFPDFNQEKTNAGTISFIIQKYLASKTIEQIEMVPMAVEDSQPKDTIYYSFTYINLATHPDYINDLFDALKNHNFIPRNSSLIDFKRIFSGEPVNKPVVWSGTISDLNYFIKLIHNRNKSVENLKQRQWEVACKCFIGPDGSAFERSRLKDQKKPKSTEKILEKISSHLI